MRRLVLDFEDLQATAVVGDADASPDRLRNMIETYRDMGFEIVITCSTVLNPNENRTATSGGGIPPALLAQLGEFADLYDEVFFGRPHCLPDGLILDDKAVTPKEFLDHDYSELQKLVNEQEEE